ncbi:hypothetical protein BDQ17DRAFT_1334731 [Cyathus striatus]|nr:hypothetical protein BDQ17DRAFT_1334731 [Cyathus striatus]
MYPNGSLGSKPRSFSYSISIRATVAEIGDGVTEGVYRAGGSADSAPSIAISTPLTAPREEGLVEMAEDDLDYGWEKQDQQAIDDAERFDDISVVGFLDEEQAVQNKVKRRKKK